jgi:spoIIIJ-associated protein
MTNAKSVITTGKTVEEAILMAVAQLAVQRDKLEIEVLEEPIKGLFGLIGNKDAKIRARIKQTMGDTAKAFLTELFEKMELEAKIDLTEEDDLIRINVSGPKMGVLIGHRGETLDAVQYLTSLVVNKNGEKYKRILLDTESYRSKREETLKRLAKRLAYKVQKTRKRHVLEPMNPFERRIIHAALQKDPYVTTHSEGEEPYRKVVITLK